MSALRRSVAPPRPLPLSYAAHLPSLNAEALKRLARMWVGKDASKLNKEACLQTICRGLSDPAHREVSNSQRSDNRKPFIPQFQSTTLIIERSAVTCTRASGLSG